MLVFEDVYRALAKGVTDLSRLAETSGRPIQEIENEPPSSRHGRAMLSMFMIARHAAVPVAERQPFVDYAASMHAVLDILKTPPSGWPGAYRMEPDFANDFPLVNAAFNKPELSAYEMAGTHQRLNDIHENAHFGRLMSLLSDHPGRDGDALYTRLRRYLVEGGVRKRFDLLRFGLTTGGVKDFLDNAYCDIPQVFVDGAGKAYRCLHCSALSAPVRQGDAVSNRCLNQACAEERKPKVEELEGSPAEWMMLKGELVLYWLSPGVDEVRLYDALRKRSPDWSLYPNRDEVDIGLPDNSVGIDVKSYASPQYLGARLAGIGETEPLLRYGRKIIAVPDRFAKGHKGYLRIARDEFRARSGKGTPVWSPEFAKLSDVTKEFAR